MSDAGTVIVGAGVGGLTAALLLAARGERVTVIERQPTSGGKMRLIDGVDAGPTVLTMKWVFDAIFAAAGADFAAEVPVRAAEVLARHAWRAGERLDLHADPARSADAIGDFAGAAEARGYRAFLAEAKHIHDTLDGPFLQSNAPTQLGLVAGTAASGGIGGLANLWRVRPYATLWRALGKHFRDPRLMQLFGRYATYAGSSPFEAPATLMLIAHVEQAGVWLVDGGMHRIAAALERVGTGLGVRVRYGENVREIVARNGRASGIVLASGEELGADAIVLNADPNAVATGLFGAGIAAAVPALPVAARSLSAVTLTGYASTHGFALARHNVFFGSDYANEFAQLAANRLPTDPTIYLCAQDRGDGADPVGPERLHLIMNAPPTGDTHPLSPAEIARCEQRIHERLALCGLTLSQPRLTITTPSAFEARFPATGGSLYGRATHGAAAAFQRPTARTKLPGLYLAGGATHPGAGVPMAAISGRLAANAVMAGRASIRR